jgi:Protein of unknown function (DUF3592)
MAKTSLIVRILRFVGWWLLVGGLTTFVIGLGFAVSTTIFLARSGSTTGRVIRFEEQVDSENQSVNYAPVFTFSADDGKTYTFRSGVATNPPEFDEGQNVSVLYIKGNPTDARINAFWQLWFVTVICCALGFFHTLIGFLFLFFTRKYVKKGAPSVPPPIVAQSQLN